MPIGHPTFWKKCSPLKMKLFNVRIDVSNVVAMVVILDVARCLFMKDLTASIPSVCGMFV